VQAETDVNRLPTAGQILRGTDKAPPETMIVRAGAVSAEFTDGEVRHLSVGNVEVVRRITVAVRDEAWNTLPPVLSDVRIEEHGDTFEISLAARHEAGELCFAWEGRISGAADGSCSFSMDGRAVTSFPYRRIGICVLLPPAEAAGSAYTASLAGERFARELPALVAPPGPSAGVDEPLVPAFDRLTIAGRQLTTDLTFSGDDFEIEDQRNWTDDSFKAYSRFPPVTEAPEQMTAGARVQQAVSVSTIGASAAGASAAAAPATVLPGTAAPATGPGRPRAPKAGPAAELVIGDGTAARVPDVGIANADESPVPSRETAELLARLAPAHLRVDLHLSDGGWAGRLDRAWRQAEALNWALELAVFVPGTGPAELDQLAAALTDISVRRVLVYRVGAECTPAADVAMVRQALAGLPPGTPFGGGTDVYFAQLNRTRPDVRAMDAVAFPITPQVHNADEESILESADGVRAVVRTVHGFWAGQPVLVGPVSLRPRYNPDAPDEPDEPAELPGSVDARQLSVFGACWALATLKALAEEGVCATTWCETTGPKGLIENATEPPYGRAFPSRPGLVFPLYHVLRDVCELRGAQVLACASDAPQTCAALAVRHQSGVTVLLANLRPHPVTASVRLGLAGPGVKVRRLNATTTEALLAAEHYRTQTSVLGAEAGTVRLDLAPYEYTRLDCASTDEKDG
jgi:D-apionolactonase